MTNATPCSKHPKYGGKRRPRSGCKDCFKFYEARQVEKGKPVKKTARERGALISTDTLPKQIYKCPYCGRLYQKLKRFCPMDRTHARLFIVYELKEVPKE